MILDEPFSGLDPVNVELFKKVILELKAQGTSIIFSSHRMEHVELFCEKLLILVKGQTVISGYLKDIKENYKKKNIIIQGNIKPEELKTIPGVLEVTKDNLEYQVKIEDKKYINSIFKTISKYNITKFYVEDANLNEIFISIVGEAYDK